MLHILRPLNLPKSNAPSCPGDIIESTCSTENVPRGPPPPPLSPACRPTNCPEVTEVVLRPPLSQMLDLGRAAVGSPPGVSPQLWPQGLVPATPALRACDPVSGSWTLTLLPKEPRGPGCAGAPAPRPQPLGGPLRLCWRWPQLGLIHHCAPGRLSTLLPSLCCWGHGALL